MIRATVASRQHILETVLILIELNLMNGKDDQYLIASAYEAYKQVK